MGAVGNLPMAQGPDHAVLSCVEWLKRRNEPVGDKLWEGVFEISQNAKAARTRLRATQMLVDRLDPIPRAPAVAIETGPVNITWSSESPTPLDPSSSSSTTPSPLNARALPASSVTDALENL